MESLVSMLSSFVGAVENYRKLSEISLAGDGWILCLTLVLLPHGIEDGVGHDGIYCLTGSIYHLAIFRRAPSLKSVAFAGEFNFSIAENGVAVTGTNYLTIDFVVLVNRTSVIIRVIRHSYSNTLDIAVNVEGVGVFCRVRRVVVLLGYVRPGCAQSGVVYLVADKLIFAVLEVFLKDRAKLAALGDDEILVSLTVRDLHADYFLKIVIVVAGLIDEVIIALLGQVADITGGVVNLTLLAVNGDFVAIGVRIIAVGGIHIAGLEVISHLLRHQHEESGEVIRRLGLVAVARDFDDELIFFGILACPLAVFPGESYFNILFLVLREFVGHIIKVTSATVHIRRRANADDIAIGSVSIGGYALHEGITIQRPKDIYAAMVSFSYAFNLNCIFQQIQNFRLGGRNGLDIGLRILAEEDVNPGNVHNANVKLAARDRAYELLAVHLGIELYALNIIRRHTLIITLVVVAKFLYVGVYVKY